MDRRPVREERAEAGQQFHLLHDLQDAPEQHRPHRLQAERVGGAELRLHRRRGALPHPARRFRACGSGQPPASRRERAGDGARAGAGRPRGATGAGAAGLWWGTWGAWAGAGVATAFANPGLAYPFVLPCLVAGACGLAASAHARWVTLLLPLAAAAVLWCPVAWLLYDALGLPILPASSALLTLVLGTAAVARSGRDPAFPGASRLAPP